ncbi:MAG: hypothetical protein KA216_10695 [Giesbergeria sp.]|nr:hypothetical protein [Giesbergeria sp.]
MTTSPKAVRCDARLLEATPTQRALDEDMSVAGLLAGQPDLSRRPSHSLA